MSASPHKIELLPENAKARFQKLMDKRDAAFDQGRRFQNDIVKMREQSTNLETLCLNALILQGLASGNGQSLKEAVSQIADKIPAPQKKQVQEIERLKNKIGELSSKRHEASEANEGFLEMTSDLIAFVDELKETANLKDFDISTLGKIPSLKAAKSKVDELSSQESQIVDAPYPALEIIEKTIERIEKLARIGQPRISHGIATGDAINFVNPSLVRGNTGFSESELQSAPFVWLHKDEIISRLAAEIENSADDENSIPAKDRDGLLKKASEELLIAERKEVFAQDAEDNSCQYRQLSPLAILQIQEA